MAMIKCKECGQSISTKADACPHCGAKTKAQPLGCGAGLLILLAIVMTPALIHGLGSSTSTPSTPPTPPKPHDDFASARGACMLFIKQILHDPSSAEFGHSSDALVNREQDGTWTVVRSVRSKNAFNAMRLSNFECHLKLNGDNWSALSVKEIQ